MLFTTSLKPLTTGLKLHFENGPLTFQKKKGKMERKQKGELWRKEKHISIKVDIVGKPQKKFF